MCVCLTYGASTAPKFEGYAKKYQGKIKVCMVNVVGGGQAESQFAEAAVSFSHLQFQG